MNNSKLSNKLLIGKIISLNSEITDLINSENIDFNDISLKLLCEELEIICAQISETNL